MYVIMNQFDRKRPYSYGGMKMKLAKTLSCVLLSLCMILSLSLSCFAEETTGAVIVKDPDGADREDIVDFVYLFSATKFGDPQMKLTDGNRGSNNSGDINSSYGSGASKNAEFHCEYDHRGTSTASVTNAPTDLVTVGTTDYYYYLSAQLKGISKVTGLCVYLQGYKAAVMDHAFDILYSTDDGATWTKLVEAHTPFDMNAVYHYENWDSNTSFDGTQYGSGKETDTTIEDAAYFYLDLELTPIEGVTNIAWACVTPRCNNAHYHSRFTEFEVYGTVTEVLTEAPTEAPTAAPTAAPTEAKDEPTEAPTQAQDDPTQAPVNTNAPETKAPEEKKGCKSAVLPGMFLCLVPAAVCFRRKKED